MFSCQIVSSATRTIRLAAALSFAVSLGVVPLVDQAVYAASPDVAYGYVEHVSVNNIKVYEPRANKTIAFLLAPKFDQVFSGDGKSTYQMRYVKPGDFVKIHYSNTLGVRHASRIFVYTGNQQNPPNKTE